MKTTFNISWTHGLGDTVNFAHALPLWLRRGYRVNVSCPNECQLLFAAAGCGRVEPVGNNLFADFHPYRQPGISKEPIEVYSRNKLAFSLLRPEPLPNIGQVWELWPEALQTKLTLDSFLTPEGKARVDEFIRDQPFVLLHTRGYSLQAEKNYSPDLEYQTQVELLRNTEADVVLLDRHGQMNRVFDDRVRIAPKTSLPELAYLLGRARLLLGIDSGPLHLARVTETPALGVWFHLEPGMFALPRANTLHIADRAYCDRNDVKAEAFNIVQRTVKAEAIVDLATRLLAGEKPERIRRSP